MLMNECCGINGPSDFTNLTYIERNNPNGATIFRIPPACCKKSIIVRGTGAAKAYEVLKQCAREGGDHSENINSKGCYSQVFQHIFATHGQWMMAVLLVVAIWSLMQMILSIITMMTPPPKPPERRRSSRAGSIARARAMSQSHPVAHKPPEPIKKTFVPLSKISSFDHPDPTRIKSTEIW
ncbi:uncharacterized protein LOC131953665 [Physella acuta]|uniref:uncharacterized protein LOC131953665 n=1 Tax=Physella acuta TaxID=109671 RepID=UPI0027DD4772|nr:uncharacterized protein LOC131953665 [Physella acuta]